MPGIHTDVGGGYLDGRTGRPVPVAHDRRVQEGLGQGTIEILDDIDNVKKLLSAQKSRLADATADDVVIRGLAHGVLHDNSGMDAKLGGRERRAVCVGENDRPVPVKEDAPQTCRWCTLR